MDVPVSPVSSYIVRYGGTRLLGEFSVRNLPPLPRQTPVIVRSDRGTEWGIVLCPATDAALAALGQTQQAGRVLRQPTLEDEQQHDTARAQERAEYASCLELIAEWRLQMQLVDVEHLFGNERIVFYYVAEQRVDFRELVKVLAKRHQARIEMRQIGIRDEAKLLADYGDCGQPVCCNTHLREMPPVSMRMAKLQKATLDPSKISGRCGRLKCCLRYEFDTYEEHRAELPPVGATVVTKTGTGRVVGQELLAKKLMIVYENQRMILTDAKDVLTVVGKQSGRSSAPADELDAPPGVAGTETREPRGDSAGERPARREGQRSGGYERRPAGERRPNRDSAGNQPPSVADTPEPQGQAGIDQRGSEQTGEQRPSRQRPPRGPRRQEFGSEQPGNRQADNQQADNQQAAADRPSSPTVANPTPPPQQPPAKSSPKQPEPEDDWPVFE